MSSRRLSEVDRRAFLGKSALTMLAGTCFSSVARVRAALAIVAEQGKPLFTEENVNAFIQAARSGRVAGGAEGVKGRAQSDVRALVREHFALSPEQEKKLDALTPQQISQIKETVQHGLSGRNDLHVRLVTSGTSRVGRPGIPLSNAGANEMRIGIEKRDVISPFPGNENTPGISHTTSWNIVCEC